MGEGENMVEATETVASVGAGPPLKPTPRWRRELRILRRDGLQQYLVGAWHLRKFHRSVRRLP